MAQGGSPKLNKLYAALCRRHAGPRTRVDALGHNSLLCKTLAPLLPFAMPIWKKPATLAIINAANRNTAAEHLGIEITELGDDFVRGRVPVDHRTVQPFGLLHGGVSVVLAESLGSIGAYYASPEGHHAVGLDITANHLRSATSGWVTGTAKPVHIGRTTHVWHIDLHNEAGELPCVSRLTMAILAPR